METKWLSDLSDLVARLQDSVALFVAGLCVQMKPPPPAEPVVQILTDLVEVKAVEDYYYERLRDPLGADANAAVWEQVILAFAWVVVKDFYAKEDWSKHG